MTPPLVLVAAVARHRVIGHANTLPWRLPGDLRHFRELTLGKPVIMGRRTFESIGKPLPGRQSIVVTRNPSFGCDGVLAAATVDAALTLAIREAERMNANEIVGAGGGALYAALIDRADRLAITEVDLEPDGDTLFPVIDPQRWRETARITPERRDGDQAAYRFVTYELR